MPPPPPPNHAAVVSGDDHADDDDLDCAVCSLPLDAPPVFQCVVGHVICTSCREEVAAPAGRRCGVCRGPMARRGERYDALEVAMKQPVESVRLPRADVNAAAVAYGYGAACHDGDRLRSHAPCHCPGEPCSFAGSTTALLGHFAAAHGWACTTGARSGESLDVTLRDGVNVVAVDRRDDDRDFTAVTGRYLVVLHVAQRPPFDRVVSAFCIRPRSPAATTSDDDDEPSSFWSSEQEEAAAVQFCQLGLTYLRSVRGRDGRLVRWYHQRTDLDVPCTDLSNGLPDADDLFQAVVPRPADEPDDEDGFAVTIRVTVE